jgi:sulfite exporter TauE/SafE
MNSQNTLHHTNHAHGTSRVAIWQGALALLTALCALYLAAALMGYAPSPERYLGQITRWWGRTMRRMRADQPLTPHWFSASVTLYGSGLLWGLLPCGLVLTALLIAANSGSASRGLFTMLAFGLGTWPVTFSMGWLTRWSLPTRLPAVWLRPIASLLMLVFSLQMTLRGLAAWGWVMHGQLGGLMLW